MPPLEAPLLEGERGDAAKSVTGSANTYRDERSRHFYRSLSSVRKVRGRSIQPSKDLTAMEVQRCVGYVEYLPDPFTCGK